MIKGKKTFEFVIYYLILFQIKLLQTALKFPFFETFFPLNVKDRAEGLVENLLRD